MSDPVLSLLADSCHGCEKNGRDDQPCPIMIQGMLHEEAEAEFPVEWAQDGDTLRCAGHVAQTGLSQERPASFWQDAAE